jgi:PilZ domain-containing protein
VEEVLNHKPFGSSINRRVSPRYQFELDIEIEWGSKIVWGRVENISREGMFIELDDVPEVGEQFTGNLSLNVPLRVIGIVRRTVSHYGIGVSFVIPEQTDQRRFAALLIALAQGSDPEAAGAELPQAKPDEPLCCVAASVASGATIGRRE